MGLPENAREIPRRPRCLFQGTCVTDSRHWNVSPTATQLIELLAQEIASELAERPAQPGYSVLSQDGHHPVRQPGRRSEHAAAPLHRTPSGPLQENC